MSEKILGKSLNTESLTKEKLIEAVKASKDGSNQNQEQITDFSSANLENHFCDLIEKMESTFPTYFKSSAELWKKYLHLAINFYKSYYFDQKEFRTKMGVSDDVLKMLDMYLNSIKQVSLLQMEGSENMFKKYVEYRLDVLNFWDQMTQNNIYSFRKLIEMINNSKNNN